MITKIHEYKGYKIQNIPYGSEPRWFIYNSEMIRVDTYPKNKLRDAKEWIDAKLSQNAYMRLMSMEDQAAKDGWADDFRLMVWNTLEKMLSEGSYNKILKSLVDEIEKGFNEGQ